MSLYQSNDVDLLLNNWDSILADVEKQKLILFEPTLDEMKEVHNIILNFIKTMKRKIYGGIALNMLVNDKDSKDAFYKPTKIPDIDFYSPEPIIDLMKLCNILHKKGYKYVAGREAMHQETYSIYVNYMLYCDISYVPRNIYNKMPYKEIDGYILIHPHFMTIDYLRMMTDPLISYWRFESNLKSFKRFFLLQKHYPLPSNNSPIDISESIPALDSALKIVFDFMINKKTIIVIGFYAYDYFLNESKIIEKKNNKFKILPIPYFEFISTNFRDDSLNLIDLLKSDIILNKELKHTEFYPFFQFTGHSVEIYLGNDLIVRIYNHNKKCIPYQDVPAINFTDGKKDEIKKSIIRIGTFPYVLLYSLISSIRGKVNNDEDTKSLYYTMTSHLTEMRNYYLSSNKKTYLDNTVFKEFIVNCIGETIQPERQKRLLIENRKKKNKRYNFTYEPDNGIRDPESIYIFANSSGNAINNPKNLKLANIMKEDDDDDDDDEINTQKSDKSDKKIDSNKSI